MEKPSELHIREYKKPADSESIKRYWDNFGPVYSARLEGPNATNSISEFDKTLKFKENTGHLRFMELACGSGYLAEHILKNKRDLFDELYFTDLSTFMVSQTKQRLETYMRPDYPAVKVEERNCEDMGDLQDNYYDIITGNLVIHIVENPDKVFSGLRRCLKPDGVVFLSYLDELELNNYFYKFQKITNKYFPPNPNVRTMFYFSKEQVMERLVNEHGFKIVDESIFDVVLSRNEDEIVDIYKDTIDYNKCESLLGAQKYQELLAEVRQMVHNCIVENTDIQIRIVNKRLIKTTVKL